MLNVDLKSKDKGTITELQCAAYLMSLGHIVSQPIGNSAPYDLIVDIDHHLYKIQCKHSNYADGKIQIECTTNINTRTRLETHTYSSDDVDFFSTFYNGVCYLIPFDGSYKSFTLRLDYPKNNSVSAVHWAEDYEASYIINKILNPDIEIEIPSSSRSGYVYSSETARQYFWITNGTINKQIKDIEDLPEGFWVGRCGKSNQFT